MTLHKIAKEDFKTYRYQLLLSVFYSIMLAIVYGYWTIVALNAFYLGVIVFLGFILVGSIVYYFWVNHLKNKKEKVDEQNVHKKY